MNHFLFTQILSSSSMSLRTNCKDLFSLLEKHSIPLLIFSAGIGDVIVDTLKNNNLNNINSPADQRKIHSNIHIISNFMNWSPDGKLIGFKGKKDYTFITLYDTGRPIHSLNKNEHSIPSGSNYYKDVSTRKNALLLGDSLTDLQMSEGLNHDTILKVGFLNTWKEQDQQKLKAYAESFDVVLINDDSMDFVINMVKQIIHAAKDHHPT